MHITKIELENIKSHIDSKFEFQAGTTAITGENGAGKTTLIEAVAWTLFDLLDYKKEDLVRRGTKKGVVRVTFVSGLDEREYTIYRDTGTGYYVYDPRLNTRIADKKEEVKRFLWQHLGLEAGTDLESLFRRAIGVPQGTFTAIFLETTTERKKAFDRLLKVEEYRQSAEKLRETYNYINGRICSVRESIARSEGELSRLDQVEAEHSDYSSRFDSVSADLMKIKDEIEELSTFVAELDEKEKQISALKTRIDSLMGERSRNELILQQCEKALAEAEAAVVKIEAARSDAEKHLQAVATIKELERERTQREKIRIELAKAESAITAVKADRKHLQGDLENLLKIHNALSGLEKLAEEQETLEKEIEVLRTELANVRSTMNLISSLDEKLDRLRVSYRDNQSEIKRLSAKTVDVGDVEKLQKTDASLLTRLGELRATLEHDRKFQGEVKNGLCPILSQKCLNLKNGQTLDEFITNQFEDLKGQIAALELEQKGVTVSLAAARESEKYSKALETLRSREFEISEEGARLKEEKATLERGIADIRSIEAELAKAEGRLSTLEDPKAKIRLLKKESLRENEVREQLTVTERNLERLESDRNILSEQVDLYKDLDARWASAVELRDRTSDARNTFVINEPIAAAIGERKAQFEKAKEQLESVISAIARCEAELSSASEGYDAEIHNSKKTAWFEAEKKRSELAATLASLAARRDELNNELQRLKALRSSLAQEFRERDRLEKVYEATAFIRDTLKEAAPRVARNYVFLVSSEANLLFREIGGNGERTLKWGEDYGISLEEGGFERPFASLSGGEQMAAALSVRLALLKQLSDIRIAFFDEPTTNMDAERRENLAMQMSQIKHFDQLFVISHDDTFEGYVDNVVHVGDK
jgi:exonuclease SbcC